MRAAFRVWVTELRPHWIGRWHCRAPDLRGEQAGEDCVMLAELSVPLRPNPPDGWVVDNTGQVTINESRRAYAVHLRMLQEWLLCGPSLSAQTSPALDGDVTGAVIANTVARIRGVDVEATAPARGQVLTAVQVGPSIRWRPAEIPPVIGPFVRMALTPASGIGDYAIVAAGRVRANGTNIGLVYNALVAEAVSVNQIRLRFNEYRVPNATFQYIVKAMTVFNSAITAPVVVFESFRNDGIILRVTDGGANINAIGQIELIVEISQYIDSSII